MDRNLNNDKNNEDNVSQLALRSGEVKGRISEFEKSIPDFDESYLGDLEEYMKKWDAF